MPKLNKSTAKALAHLNGISRTRTGPVADATHASRNPDMPSQKPRRNNNRNVDKAAKAVRDKKELEFARDVDDALHELYVVKARELADRYDKRYDTVVGILKSESRKNRNRAINLHNARLHDEAVKRNANKAAGSRLDAIELQEDMSDDELDEEEKERLVSQLREHRAVRKKGVRSTPKAAARDAYATGKSLFNELLALLSRTGAVGFLVIAKATIGDEVLPVCYSTGLAERFIEEYLQETPTELAAKLESFAVLNGNGLVDESPKNPKELRNAISEKIIDGFHEITGNDKLRFLYENYERSIVLKHRVELRGYPYNDGKPVYPGEIESPSILFEINNALDTYSCKWARLTPREFQDYEDKVKKMEASGELARKKRKPRATKAEMEERKAIEAESGQKTAKRRKTSGPTVAGEGGDRVGETETLAHSNTPHSTPPGPGSESPGHASSPSADSPPAAPDPSAHPTANCPGTTAIPPSNISRPIIPLRSSTTRPLVSPTSIPETPLDRAAVVPSSPGPRPSAPPQAALAPSTSLQHEKPVRNTSRLVLSSLLNPQSPPRSPLKTVNI